MFDFDAGVVGAGVFDIKTFDSNVEICVAAKEDSCESSRVGAAAGVVSLSDIVIARTASVV